MMAKVPILNKLLQTKGPGKLIKPYLEGQSEMLSQQRPQSTLRRLSLGRVSISAVNAN
jgi:hypothetical protein